MLKEIENATKKFEITQELAEKEARVNVCKRFEEEFVPLQLEENDEAITSQEQIARFLRFTTQRAKPYQSLKYHRN